MKLCMLINLDTEEIPSANRAVYYCLILGNLYQRLGNNSGRDDCWRYLLWNYIPLSKRDRSFQRNIAIVQVIKPS